MPVRSRPHPTEMLARRYRRVHARLDRQPADHIERAGFGYPDGYRGAYAERREYAQPRGTRRAPAPTRSGWPSPIHALPPEAYERHLRALRDRDLARAVDFALYGTIGADAERISVYAADAVITLAGMVPFPEAAEVALETAWAVPGVRRVRNRLRVRGIRGRGGRAGRRAAG